MAKIPYENPGSTEVQSPLIAGITDGLNKISGMINMKTKTDTVNLQEVYVDATDRYRMYEAPQGQKNWLRSPEPIIRKNGNIINPTMDFFTISYMGGSITFAEDARQTSTDEFSAEVAIVVESDLEMPLKADLDPDTKKLISSQIPDTLATKEELKPLQDKLEMDKGYFTDADQLKRTYPVGEVGWHAVVGTTDTVWIWDGDTGAWVNSGTSDINASKVPFTKTTEVDSTNVQDAIEKLGINKANKDLTNVENTIFKNKGNSAGLAYNDLTNITDITFKQKGDAAGLATKDLSNVDNTIFKAKGNTAGLAYADLVNINNATFKNKGDLVGLEINGLCNCTKTGTNFNLVPVYTIPDNKNFSNLYFMSPADYNTGDTISVNGTQCTIYINGTSVNLPNNMFRQNQKIGALYSKSTNTISLYGVNNAFLDLSNVGLGNFNNVALKSHLGVAPSMNQSYDSATDTYTLSFQNTTVNNPIQNYQGQWLPFTAMITNLKNTTKFKAPNKSGSQTEYKLFIGNTASENLPAFEFPKIYINGLIDFSNTRIVLEPASLFMPDQYNKGIQLPTNLRLRPANANYGSYLRFGDGDYCYLAELADDQLTLNGTRLDLKTTGSGYPFTLTASATNSNINMLTFGTGKALYNNTEIAKVDLSNITSTQLDLKLLNASNFINHKCNATKSGTVFTLTVSPATVIITNVFSASFIATANFNAGDTFTIQFSSGSYSDLVPYVNGKIATKGFLLNDVVTLNVNLNSKKVFFRSSAGGLELPADYNNGGIILPNAPEEIQKVTAKGYGLSPMLKPSFKMNMTSTHIVTHSSGPVKLILSRNTIAGYVMALYYYTNVPSLELHKIEGGLDFNTVSSVLIPNTHSIGPIIDISSNSLYTFVLYNNTIGVYNNSDLSRYKLFLAPHNYTKIVASEIANDCIYGAYLSKLYICNMTTLTDKEISSSEGYTYTNIIEDKYSNSLNYFIKNNTNNNNLSCTYLIDNMNSLRYGFSMNDNILEITHNMIYYESSGSRWFGYSYFNPYNPIRKMVISSSDSSKIVSIKANLDNNVIFSLREDGLLEYYGISGSGIMSKWGEYKLSGFSENVIMAIEDQYKCLYINAGSVVWILRYALNYNNYALYD